jgi:hypothetical protein
MGFSEQRSVEEAKLQNGGFGNAAHGTLLTLR